MAKVTELGYLGLAVRDLAAWKTFATEIVGLEAFDEGDPDTLFLRMDLWHHRIVLHRSEQDGLAYLGWRVAGETDLDDMATQLEKTGIAFRSGTRAEADARRVLGLLILEDPDGNPTEIFFGPQVDRHKPFHPGRPMFSRFVTGDQGLGHVVISQADAAAGRAFYRALGFVGGVEYRVPSGDGDMLELSFMGINERQHSVAFGVGSFPARINHLMLEYSDFDDVGLAHELVRSRKLPVAMQLGKHSNDQAYSFYFGTPSGWLLELGHGACHSATQAEFYTRDIFGHANEAEGFGAQIQL